MVAINSFAFMGSLEDRDRSILPNLYTATAVSCPVTTIIGIAGSSR
jgi:hypothetical protein